MCDGRSVLWVLVALHQSIPGGPTASAEITRTSSMTEQIRSLRSPVDHISDSDASQPLTTLLMPKMGINIASAMNPTAVATDWLYPIR